MFSILLFFHSISRWLVVLSLGYVIYRSANKYQTGAAFSKTDNKLRHWTATIAHIQLMIGMVMYFKSPAVAQFRVVIQVAGSRITEPFFFGLIHISMMIVAIVIITFGSAVSRRQASDRQKFKLMAIFFSIGLLIILLAIPWPFSPLAQRPFIRNL